MSIANCIYSTVVIGAGHAGIEACTAAARICKQYSPSSKVALITLKDSNIGEMSCNPAFGGIGKGTIVREIDALDGIMGKAADMAGIHFKILNQKKGHAVWGYRCQADRKLYKQAVKKLLSEYDNLDIIFDSCEDIDFNEDIKILKLKSGTSLKAKTIVLTTGTFLSGMILQGELRIPAGRINEDPSYGLSQTLARYNFDLGRLKTGTPPRLDKNTINLDILEKQYGDEKPRMFSYMHDKPFAEQVCCYMTSTNSITKEIILKNKDRSPALSGQIKALGPRYCPSIEDKIRRFENENHRVFLEPEGLDSNLIYPNGLSTSLPADVQDEYMRSIKGLENVKILQYGYAIEYDFVNPQELLSTLETKKIQGLYFAGQINGTTGYEEAGGQGIVAGFNAGLKACEVGQTFTTGRDESYIGVMIDDLIFKGIKEPYRMFTSRSEYRLSIRADNADERMTPKIIALNICSNARKAAFESKTRQISEFKSILNSKKISPNELKAIDSNFIVAMDGVKRTGFEILSNKNYGLESIEKIFAGKLEAFCQEVKEAVYIEAKYSNYLDRQKQDICFLRKEAEMNIPQDINFDDIKSISSEIKEILKKLRPQKISDLHQIQGITPASIIAITVFLNTRVHFDE